MKRIIKYIILSIILMPINIYANMWMPPISEMIGYINNTDGASIFTYNSANNEYVESNEKIPYNTKANVLYTTEKIYYVRTCEDEICKDVNNQYIKKEDISILNNGKLDKENFRVEENNITEKFLVFEEGAYLLNAPFKSAGRIKENIMIPKGTIFETKIYDHAYVYVEYNGYNGYLFRYEPLDISGEALEGYWKEYSDEPMHIIPIREEEAYTANKITIYKDIEHKEILGTIEPNQKVTSLNSKKYNQYIKYGDEIKIIDGNSKHYIAVAVNFSNHYIALEDADIHEYCDLDSIIIGKINKDEIIEASYISYNFTPLYLDNSTEYQTNYTKGICIKLKNKDGWLITPDLPNGIGAKIADYHIEPINTEPEIKEEEQPVVEEEKPNEVIPSENKKEEEKEKEVIKEEGLTRYNIVILAVAGTVILALLMLVIIKLINRNKKVKEARSTSINGMSNNIIEIIIPNTENITNDKTGENK